MAEAADYAALGDALYQTERGVYFAPIRHHSPACGWAVRELIRTVKPSAVLIEAPRDFERHIDLILDKDTRPPVAIAAMIDDGGDRRIASYYPFCAHSPEYVALTTGREMGAALRFIDLPSAHKAMLNAERRGDSSLETTDEHYFDSGDFVAALCQHYGCRNGFELWDHLFESRLGRSDWRSLLADIGAYCAGLREATSIEQIVANGDAARESAMLAAIKDASANGDSVVVVAGGFHIPMLAGITAPQNKPDKAKATTADSYLVRYGFEALDALNGYSAGLPQPGYYDTLWTAANSLQGEPPWRETATSIINAFAARQRELGQSISVPEQVETLRIAESLAQLRGHRGASRYDFIDAVRTALVKGETTNRDVWTERLLAFLCGSAIGDVPVSAGSPPIVEDARRRARQLRIDVTDGERRRRSLDIRRKPAHRKASQFFHAMALLDSQFAERQAGPDFVRGVNIGLLFEDWSYAWSPLVEGRLIEASVCADNVGDACLNVIRDRRLVQAEEGKGRDIAALTALLIEGVLAGLGHELQSFLDELARDINASTEFADVASALRTLHSIAVASGPLEIPTTLDLGGVTRTAFERLAYLCADLPQTPKERIQDQLGALRIVVELLRGADAELLDSDIFDDAIDRVADAAPPPALLGAVLAICVQSGRRDANVLADAVAGHFAGTVETPEERIGVVHGILFAAPELLLREPTVLTAIDSIMAGMDETEFLELLPHIRLAFTELNPREADKLAALLVDIHGGRVADFVSASTSLGEADLARGVAANLTVAADLTEDGLADWLESGG